MQVGHVKHIRRALVGLILVVLCAVSFNYIQTFRRRSRIIKQAAAILSTEMLRSADSIEYSENENGVTRFQLKAQRLLETRQGKNLLEGIEASDRNPDGSTRNHIRSRRAEYDSVAKKAFFHDNVQIELSQGAEIRTESLRYDLQANVGDTDDRIELISRQIHGWARGVHYDHDRKELNLKAEIDVSLERIVHDRGGQDRKETMHARSQSAFYSEDGREIRLLGAAHVDSDTATLSGGEIKVTFTEDKQRITSLICRGNSIYRSKDPAESRTLQGDRMDFGISKESGNLERIDVFDHAAFSTGSHGNEQTLGGSEIHLDLDPVENLPTHLQSKGGVVFRSRKDSEETVLLGDQLEADFIPKSSILDKMKVRGGAHMTSQSSRGAGTDELLAQEIRMGFRVIGGRSALQQLDADQSVQWISTAQKEEGEKKSGGVRSLTASNFQMLYSSAGDFLGSGRALGNVVLKGLPGAESGKMEVRQMKADEVRFHFFPQDNRIHSIEGSGHVEVIYRRPAESSSGAGEQESRTSSSELKAAFRQADGAAEDISQWGNFIFQDGMRTAYSGRSDYSAGKDLLVLSESPKIIDANGTTTGDLITYDRKAQLISIQNHVRSILKPGEGTGGTPFNASSASSSPSIITAKEMKYWTESSRILYSGQVQMLSENGQLECSALNVLDTGERIEADGSIRHLLPRSAMAQDEKTAERRQPRRMPAGKKDAPTNTPILIRSSQMRYFKAESSVHYSGDVTLEFDDLWMSSNSMDAVFENGGRRIERAAARGKVQIREAGRVIKGDTGDYYLVPGKFVVTGELAEIYDPQKGKSSARRLTFFNSDDRILLENR